MKKYLLLSSKKNKSQHSRALEDISKSYEEVKDYDGADFLLVLGGDGSLNYLVNNYFSDLEKKSKSIIYYPCGTANDFAKTLKITEDIDLSALLIDNIFRGAIKVPVPIMRCNEKKFINVASFGAPAQVTDSGDSALKEFTGKVSYYLSAFNQMFLEDCFDIKVNNEFEIKDVRGFLISQGLFVGGGIRSTTSLVANLKDHFNFLTTKAKGFIESVGSLMEVSQGNLSDDTKIVSKFYTEASFKTNKEINVKLDGEVYKGSEFKIDKSKVLVHFYSY